MEHLGEISRFELCTSIGNCCDRCVAHTAERMAAVCDTLRGQAIENAFLRAYPEADCHGMRSVFERKYLNAVIEAAGSLVTDLLPVEPVAAQPLAAVAAAGSWR